MADKGKGTPAPAVGPPAATLPHPMRVRATQLGYYGDKLQRVGDVFTIAGRHLFSAKWMEQVPPTTPERTTGSNASLRQEHDAFLGGASRTDGIVVGRDDVGEV